MALRRCWMLLGVLGSLGVLALAATGRAHAAPLIVDRTRAAEPTADDAGKKKEAPQNPPCIEFEAYAVYSVGYDHVVRIMNDCDKRAGCVVSTNVNPDEIRTTVPPKKYVDVVTFRGSPAREFTARVLCKLEG